MQGKASRRDGYHSIRGLGSPAADRLRDSHGRPVGKFKAWNPYFLGLLLMCMGVIFFVWDEPARGRYGWIEPGTRRLAGVVLLAGGAWTVISAVRRPH